MQPSKLTVNTLVAALAGMSLTYALDTLGTSQYGILVASETENLMTSVERVFTYTKIDPEPGYLTDSQPPEDWPKTGSLTLRDLSLAYLKGAPRILDDINVSVAAKEKVGVVGRTGAGKSSLVAALFRMPEPEGNVRMIIFVISSLSSDLFALAIGRERLARQEGEDFGRVKLFLFSIVIYHRCIVITVRRAVFFFLSSLETLYMRPFRHLEGVTFGFLFEATPPPSPLPSPCYRNSLFQTLFDVMEIANWIAHR